MSATCSRSTSSRPRKPWACKPGLSDPAEVGAVLDQALASSGGALVEAVVDPAEPFLPPKRMEKYAKNLDAALDKGAVGADAIRDRMAQEPSRTLLKA